MATDFQEFLQKKAVEFKLPERREARQEWIDALRQLFSDIAFMVRQADPQGLLEITHFDLDRHEPMLGHYSAPALKISLGEASVQVVPMGRYALGYARLDPGDRFKIAGRVDFTSGVSKHVTYRLVDQENGSESWIVPDESGRPVPLDQPKLEAILRDFWS